MSTKTATALISPTPIVREYRIQRTGTGRLAGLVARMRGQRTPAAQFRWQQVPAAELSTAAELRAQATMLMWAR